MRVILQNTQAPRQKHQTNPGMVPRLIITAGCYRCPIRSTYVPPTERSSNADRIAVRDLINIIHRPWTAIFPNIFADTN